MKKIATLLLIIIFINFCFSGCLDFKEHEDYFTKTRDVTMTVYSCVQNKDADGIKKLLCDRLRNLPDIDQQIQKFFDSIDGNVVSADIKNSSVSKSSSSKDAYEYTEISAIAKIPT